MTAIVSFEGTETAPEELESRAAKLAGGLYALGLRAGDVVAVLLRNDAAYVDVMLACRLGGYHFCPLNWHFTPAELAYIVQDCGAKAVIGHADLLTAARDALPEGLTVLAVGDGTAASGTLPYETWLGQQAAYDGPLVSPGGHMAYTSGTTGRPKGVVRAPVPVEEIDDFRNRTLAVVGQVYGLRPGCRALMTAPLYHSAPSMFAQYAAIAAGLFVIAPRFDAEQTLALVERHRIDALYCVPTMYVRLLKLPREVRERYDLSSLRFVGSTGAPCAPDVKRDLIEWLGPIVHETYASSETGYITVIDSHEALERPGSVGRPLGDAQIRVVDENGKDCAPGEVGVLYVRQPAHTDFTYRGRPEARAEAGLDGLVSVGDMGYLDDDGYLYICDRAVDMVISGGVNIYPAEIEAALLGLDGVLDCTVFGVPDPEFGERLHALVQPEPGATPDPDALRTALRTTLAGFKVPRTLDLVPDLPRDPNGKIAKHRVRASYLKSAVHRA
ncbi:acyl-CoA synthetase [Streptomyces spiroverticillatus]|uniref:Acyl-CoA synthetase n=1 Tax=Streptomyces finlayi TaxID=67296 RepID=A0A918X212_9ACTN|nr:AMP-binding protein [Streptomyces finlayi]GHA23293.1 acyl-CoA synthetase [Streptomyces spiroverticillatus]GHD04767.1 acyl-CoA synthetase [Streptomyces finlayi]